jgi:hypothetical protein
VIDLKAKREYECEKCKDKIKIGEEFVRFKAFGVVTYFHKRCFSEEKEKA